MTAAYRTGGGSVQWVKGGLKGDHLSESHRVYKAGYSDFTNGLPSMHNPPTPYKSGYTRARQDALKFQLAIDRERERVRLGMSKGAYLLHLKYDVSNN